MVEVDQAWFQGLLSGIFSFVNYPLYLHKEIGHFLCPIHPVLLISPGQLPKMVNIAECMRTVLVGVVGLKVIMDSYPFILRENAGSIQGFTAPSLMREIVSVLLGRSGM